MYFLPLPPRPPPPPPAVPPYTPLTHTQLIHTPLAHAQLTHTPLAHTQLAHLVTSTCTLRGRHGLNGTGLALVARLVPGDAARLCAAGVALGDIHFHFAWQEWHLVTSTCTLRGRRGTYGTGLALAAPLLCGNAARLCVAGVALGDIHLHFAWQAWHLRHWAGSGGALGSR